MTDPITVRWTWALPPFVATYTDRHGRTRGVARWTPWAAEARAWDLWCSYIDMLFRVARQDLKAGRFGDADEILAYIRAADLAAKAALQEHTEEETP